MVLQALLFSPDEKIVRVFRRVLADLEINVEICGELDTALQKLTRQRFEAVIVDCADDRTAAQLLGSTRSAPSNKRAVAVALVDPQTALRSAFETGAHFVLYKPISSERAKTSFRAVRALMKRERRRNARVPVEFPIVLRHTTGEVRAVTVDLSEGGAAVGKLNSAARGLTGVRFSLPGSTNEVQCGAEVAWETPTQLGLRFVELGLEFQTELKEFINRQTPEPEKDDPPVECKLTDLSAGACYVELASPFPVRTRVTLSMKVQKLRVQAEGVVRVMHPEVGMGMEFTRGTTQQRADVEKFIRTLTENSGLVPELWVEPQGLEPAEPSPRKNAIGDPLLQLFHSDLTLEAFAAELRAQRGHPDAVAASE